MGSPAVITALFALLLSFVHSADNEVALVRPSGQAKDVAQVSTPWKGTTVNDLFREYGNIFRHGNRNAASHLWVRFLLERSEQMTRERLLYMFSGFCAVSGSPVRPSDYNRYKLTLDHVDGSGKVPGFFHYCCWPCVCDTQDFIRVDTRNVTTSDGISRSYKFAVLGNVCEHPEELTRPFQDPFGRGTSTLEHDAPEVRCGPSGELLDAPLSDHGYTIIAMFFDYPDVAEESAAVSTSFTPQPGRISEVAGVKFQDEREFADMCRDRERNGFNSGMGEIFRKVAAITPIIIPEAPQLAPVQNDSMAGCAAGGTDGTAVCENTGTKG